MIFCEMFGNPASPGHSFAPLACVPRSNRDGQSKPSHPSFPFTSQLFIFFRVYVAQEVHYHPSRSFGYIICFFALRGHASESRSRELLLRQRLVLPECLKPTQATLLSQRGSSSTLRRFFKAKIANHRIHRGSEPVAQKRARMPESRCWGWRDWSGVLEGFRMDRIICRHQRKLDALLIYYGRLRVRDIREGVSVTRGAPQPENECSRLEPIDRNRSRWRLPSGIIHSLTTGCGGTGWGKRGVALARPQTIFPHRGGDSLPPRNSPR